MTNIELYNEFNDMRKMPIVELYNEREEEYEDYTIVGSEYGVAVLYTDVSLEWDCIFSLDEHLQGLVDLLEESLL